MTDLENTVQQALTPTDTVTEKFKVPASSNNEQPTKAIRCGTGGVVICVNDKGEEITFTNVVDGEYLFGRYVRIKATGTSGSSFVGFF